jgi:hypothetical protein
MPLYWCPQRLAAFLAGRGRRHRKGEMRPEPTKDVWRLLRFDHRPVSRGQRLVATGDFAVERVVGPKGVGANTDRHLGREPLKPARALGTDKDDGVLAEFAIRDPTFALVGAAAPGDLIKDAQPTPLCAVTLLHLREHTGSAHAAT